MSTPGRTRTLISGVRNPAPYPLDHGSIKSRARVERAFAGLQPASFPELRDIESVQSESNRLLRGGNPARRQQRFGRR